MKKKVVTAIMAVSLVLSAVVFTGCGGGAKVSAEEYVEGLYKLMINMDAEGAKKVGFSDGDIKKYKEALEKSVSDNISSMNDSFSQQFGVSLDDSLLKEYAQEYINAMGKLSATVSVESKSESECSVKVETTCLDLPGITADAMKKARDSVKASEYGTSDEYNKALIPVYVRSMIDMLKNYTPSSETVGSVVTVKKDGNSWVTDIAEFSKNISAAAIKKAE